MTETALRPQANHKLKDLGMAGLVLFAVGMIPSIMAWVNRSANLQFFTKIGTEPWYFIFTTPFSLAATFTGFSLGLAGLFIKSNDKKISTISLILNGALFLYVYLSCRSFYAQIPFP